MVFTFQIYVVNMQNTQAMRVLGYNGENYIYIFGVCGVIMKRIKLEEAIVFSFI